MYNDQQPNSIQMEISDNHDLEENRSELETEEVIISSKPPSFWSIMKIVWVKLAKNPNAYACISAIIWALLANR